MNCSTTRADAAVCGARQDKAPARSKRDLPSITGTCSETPLTMALTCAGMSSVLRIVDPTRIRGRNAIKRGDQINLYVGIGILSG